MMFEKQISSSTVISVSVVAATLLLLASAASAVTYYVDSVGGNDANSGTSDGSAWKTLTPVNNKTFAPGDFLLFRCGGSWVGQLNPKGSGASDGLIVIGSQIKTGVILILITQTLPARATALQQKTLPPIFNGDRIGLQEWQERTPVHEIRHLSTA